MCEKKIPKWAEMAKAWAEGEQIQVRNLAAEEWRDCSEEICPSFYPHRQYRVKPKDVVLYTKLEPSTVAKHRVGWSSEPWTEDNIKATFDKETGKLLSVELIK